MYEEFGDKIHKVCTNLYKEGQKSVRNLQRYDKVVIEEWINIIHEMNRTK